MKKFIGIDISKEDFYAAYPEDEGSSYTVLSYPNTESGVSSFLKSLAPDWHCVLESTGNYSLLLTYRLVEENRWVSVLNPKESIHFRKLTGQIWKDDSSDAKLLSLYGQKLDPKPYQKPASELIELKQKRTFLRQLKKQKQAMECLLHSLSVHPQASASVEQWAKEHLSHLSEQIDKVQQSIGTIIREEFGEVETLVRSVKGIGPKVAWALIVATQGFKAFDSPRQFAKFIGISPTYGQSGTSVKMASHINRSGDPQLRALLYVCTWSAIRYNAPCKELYDRLKARGKPSKVALVAVMNKLIRQVFAVVQKGVEFDNDFEEKMKEKWCPRPVPKSA